MKPAIKEEHAHTQKNPSSNTQTNTLNRKTEGIEKHRKEVKETKTTVKTTTYKHIYAHIPEDQHDSQLRR